MRKSVLVAASIWAVSVLVGCGGPAGPKLLTVTGVVTQGGKPLAGVTLTFYPDKAKGNKGPLADAQANANGEFTVDAVQGAHKVVVTCPVARSGATPEQMAAARDCNIPATCNNIDTTTVTAEVTPGAKVTLTVPEN